MKLHANIYDECPECDSWNVRLVETTSDEIDNKLVVIYHMECRECGFTWKDYDDWFIYNIWYTDQRDYRYQESHNDKFEQSQLIGQ